MKRTDLIVLWNRLSVLIPYFPVWVIFIILLFFIWIGINRKPVIDTFEQAKIYLENKVFYDHPYTLYCNAEYDEERNIIWKSNLDPVNFTKRFRYMEWEHIVPVETFGKKFKEWTQGDRECVNNGNKFYGRKCVKLVNSEFRKIEADLYNIYPAIGAVNAVRGKREYALLPEGQKVFGECGIKIKSKKFEPPDRVKGLVARVSLYMNHQYEQIDFSKDQIKLFEKWAQMFPVDEWECLWAKRIKKIQGNINPFIEKPCKKGGFY